MIDDKKRCYLCGSTQNLQVHHCLFGNNRKKADKLGLMVYLCMDCHTGSRGVHIVNSKGLKELQILAQKKFEETHTRDEFMEIFHKNYLWEEE